MPTPTVATKFCDGPRIAPWPLLIAAAIATHRALPVPAMLSNTSGARPGMPMVMREVFAALPGPVVATMVLPSVPV